MAFAQLHLGEVGHELKFDDIIKGQLASGCPSNYSWHVKVGVYIRSLVPLSSHIQDRCSKGTLNSTVKKSGIHMNWMVDFFWVRLWPTIEAVCRHKELTTYTIHITRVWCPECGRTVLGKRVTEFAYGFIFRLEYIDEKRDMFPNALLIRNETVPVIWSKLAS